jgi:hypothetical protein
MSFPVCADTKFINIVERKREGILFFIVVYKMPSLFSLRSYPWHPQLLPTLAPQLACPQFCDGVQEFPQVCEFSVGS